MYRTIVVVILFYFCACQTETEVQLDRKEYFKSLTENELKTEYDNLNGKIRKNVNDGDLYLERSFLFQAMGDNQAALADADRALKTDVNNPAFYLQKGELMILVRDYSQAENALIKCSQIDRENTVCRIKLAELFFYTRRFNDAMAWVNQVLRIDKYHADGYFLKGMIHLAAGDSSLAQSSFQTATEQNPDFFEASFQLGMLLASQGNPLAIEYYNNAIRVKPERVEAYYNKGLICQELGDYNEALKTYSNLLKVDPNYKEAHFNMGYVNMFYLKAYKQGAVHFTEAIMVAPDYYQAYYNRGYCYELMGDVQRALIDYNNALLLKPDYTLAAQGKERVITF